MAKWTGLTEPPPKELGDWVENLSTRNINKLAKISSNIHNTVDETVKSIAAGKIRLGQLLLEAQREFGKYSRDFTKWRVEQTPIKSKQHALYLMQIATKFADSPKLIESANFSVLQELVLADNETIKWVEYHIDAGNPPTVAEVREKVKESKGTSKKGVVQVGAMSGAGISPHAQINQITQASLSLRIRAVLDRKMKGIDADFLILGMDPDPQTPCHPESLNAIRDLWQEEAQNPDELAAIRDSYDRITQEFENW